MYERFTERTRHAFQLADQEARRLGHEYVGAEHILLGLSKEGRGVAAAALVENDLDLTTLRSQLSYFMADSQVINMVPKGKLPQTPRAKLVVERAMAEAVKMGHNFISTEHVLLAVLQDEDSPVADAFRKNDVDVASIRISVMKLLGHVEVIGSPMNSHMAAEQKLVIVEPGGREDIAVRLLESMFRGLVTCKAPGLPEWAARSGPQLARTAVHMADELLKELSKEA